jgi:hypothetical protein
MGFLKDMRDLSKAGKEMQKDKFGTSNPFSIMKQGVAQAADTVKDLQADQAKAQYLMASGMPAQATIQGMRDTGMTVNEMPQIELDLLVQVPGREAYTVTHRQVMAHSVLGQLQPGATIPVHVDPQDQGSLMIG